MTDSTIFFIGLFNVALGLIFVVGSIYEVRKIEKKYFRDHPEFDPKTGLLKDDRASLQPLECGKREHN